VIFHVEPRTRQASRPEEMAASLTHGLGLLASLIAVPFLIVDAVGRHNPWAIVGFSVFSAAVVALYASSTLYHAFPGNRAKSAFRAVDHAAIYFLIAATYTPFSLGVLRGPWGWSLLGAIWALAVAGIVLSAIRISRPPYLFPVVYVIMGWLVVVAAKPVLRMVPLPGVLWVMAGGLLYTTGLAFFAADRRMPYGHTVWHLFVLGGTTCHYVAVLGYAG
jgi:hemolysin III